MMVTKQIIINKKTFNTTSYEGSYWTYIFEEYVNNFISETFNSKIPLIKVIENKRLSRAQARFCRQGMSNWIDVSHRLVRAAQDEGFKNPEIFAGIESILRHEAIHYVLYFLNYENSDGTSLFETLLSKTNSVSSGSTPERYRVAGNTPAIIAAGFLKVCPQCKHEQIVLTNSDKYYCAHCSKVSKSIRVKNEYVFLTGNNLVIKTVKNYSWSGRRPEDKRAGNLLACSLRQSGSISTIIQRNKVA